jgi:hypothetical protein
MQINTSTIAYPCEAPPPLRFSHRLHDMQAARIQGGYLGYRDVLVGHARDFSFSEPRRRLLLPTSSVRVGPRLHVIFVAPSARPWASCCGWLRCFPTGAPPCCRITRSPTPSNHPPPPPPPPHPSPLSNTLPTLSLTPIFSTGPIPPPDPHRPPSPSMSGAVTAAGSKPSAYLEALRNLPAPPPLSSFDSAQAAEVKAIISRHSPLSAPHPFAPPPSGTCG